jgi:uncharacterized protein YciI
MDFLIYSRGSAAVAESDDAAALNEQHWSYMDRFADRLTARGPTLGPDRESWTGSLHVVDLSGPEAARRFVAEEPYQRAGRFAEHSIWRFDNLLGRTMWQFPSAADEPRFLVLARGVGTPVAVADLASELRDVLVLYGALRDLDDGPTGVALAVQASSREALDVLLSDPRTGLADRGAVDVHDWEFGGRR